MSFPDLHTDDDGTVRFNDPVSPDDGVIPSDIKKLLREHGLYSSVLTDSLTTARPMIDVSTSTTIPWSLLYNPELSWQSVACTDSPTPTATATVSVGNNIKDSIIYKCDCEIAHWKSVEARTDDDYMLGICYGAIQAYQDMKSWVS